MATAWQATVRISGTERTVEAWLADPELSSLERLMTVVTAFGSRIIDLDGMRLPVLHALDTDGSLMTDTVEAVLRVAESRSTNIARRRRIYPGRYRRFQLEASYLARIEGADPSKLQRYLGFSDELEWRGKRGDPARPRSRSVDRIVSQGDVAWARLGVWPYAVYGANRLPADWRRRRETSDALDQYVTDALR